MGLILSLVVAFTGGDRTGIAICIHILKGIVHILLREQKKSSPLLLVHKEGTIVWGVMGKRPERQKKKTQSP